MTVWVDYYFIQLKIRGVGRKKKKKKRKRVLIEHRRELPLSKAIKAIKRRGTAYSKEKRGREREIRVFTANSASPSRPVPHRAN